MNTQEFEKNRREQIQKLMDSATPEEKQRIRKARREGRKLRKQLKRLEL